MTPLRKRMTEELQLRNLSPITAAVYPKAVERFAKYFRQPPDRLGAEEVRQWLLYLINDRKVAAASLQVIGRRCGFCTCPRSSSRGSTT